MIGNAFLIETGDFSDEQHDNMIHTSENSHSYSHSAPARSSDRLGEL
jgi:hypothetical protein